MYPNALKWIFNYNNNAKLIFILRDRVDRAYSQYRHNKRFRPNEIDYDFENSLFNEEKTLRSNPFNKGSKKYYEFRDKFNYIERSCYNPQLEALHNIFGKNNILILKYNTLFDDNTCDVSFNKIGNFLNLDLSNLTKKKAMINSSIKNEMNTKRRRIIVKKYFQTDISECKNNFGIII